MANNKTFKIKNGLQAGRYLGSNGVETAGTVGYDLANASYDSVSFSVSSQSTQPGDVVFSSDGTKMYINNQAGSSSSVEQYNLSTAYDISTASHSSADSLTVNTQDTSPFGITFKPDGTKLYITGSTGDNVYQYTLTTGYDLSSASYDSVSFSYNSQDTATTGTLFNSDGTKMYMLGAGTDAIYQYSLSIAYDVSTASYDSVSFSVSSQSTAPYGFRRSSDGTKFFVAGNGNVNMYTLSTAYDLSTASYTTAIDITGQDTLPYGLDFNSDGTKMIVIGITGDNVYQYSTALLTQTLDLSTGGTFSFTSSGATDILFSNPPASGTAVGFTLEVNNTGGYALTWPSSVKWHLGTAPTATASKELYTFVTTDGGTTYYGKLAGSDIA
jgi:hypothetical protein